MNQLKFQPLPEIESCLAKSDIEGVANILQKAVLEYGYRSATLDAVAEYICNRRLPFYYFLSEYLVNNPNKITGVQLFMAEVYAQNDQEDLATVESRNFLIKILNWISGSKQSISQLRFQHMISGAHLFMTSAFTRAGARTYSKQVLNFALQTYVSDPFCRNRLNKEITNLESELSETDRLPMI